MSKYAKLLEPDAFKAQPALAASLREVRRKSYGWQEQNASARRLKANGKPKAKVALAGH